MRCIKRRSVSTHFLCPIHPPHFKTNNNSGVLNTRGGRISRRIRLLVFPLGTLLFVSTQIKDRRSQPGLRAKLRLLNLVMSSGLQTRIARYLPPGLPGGSGVLAVCEKIKLMCVWFVCVCGFVPCSEQTKCCAKRHTKNHDVVHATTTAQRSTFL